MELKDYLEAQKRREKQIADGLNRLFLAIVREARVAGFEDGNEYIAAIDEMNRDLWGRNPKGRKW